MWRLPVWRGVAAARGCSLGREDRMTTTARRLRAQPSRLVYHDAENDFVHRQVLEKISKRQPSWIRELIGTPRRAGMSRNPTRPDPPDQQDIRSARVSWRMHPNIPQPRFRLSIDCARQVRYSAPSSSTRSALKFMSDSSTLRSIKSLRVAWCSIRCQLGWCVVDMRESELSRKCVSTARSDSDPPPTAPSRLITHKPSASSVTKAIITRSLTRFTRSDQGRRTEIGPTCRNLHE